MGMAACVHSEPGVDRNRRHRGDGNSGVRNGFPTHSQPQTQYLSLEAGGMCVVRKSTLQALSECFHESTSKALRKHLESTLWRQFR